MGPGNLTFPRFDNLFPFHYGYNVAPLLVGLFLGGGFLKRVLCTDILFFSPRLAG